MLTTRNLTVKWLACLLQGLLICSLCWAKDKGANMIENADRDWRAITDAEWKKMLDPAVYKITRQKGTERAFSGKYDKFYEAGIYVCSNCRLELFSSEHKFDSGTGWPSYWQGITAKSIEYKLDKGNWFLPDRTEILCNRCGAHLGHVFDDGPAPTGKRYCVNSLSLDFIPK